MVDWIYGIGRFALDGVCKIAPRRTSRTQKPVCVNSGGVVCVHKYDIVLRRLWARMQCFNSRSSGQRRTESALRAPAERGVNCLRKVQNNVLGI